MIPVSHARHRFQWLPSGSAAIAALRSLIDQAQKSVCLEMYIYKADATGDSVRKALLDARRRGVRVRVLLDDFGSAGLPNDYFAELIESGAQLRYFNPSRALRAAFRDHRKLCVVDLAYAVVGGFNIGDEYNGDGLTAGWHDLGLWLQGPLALELEASFDRMFIAARADTPAVVAFARGIGAQQAKLDQPALLGVGPGFQSSQLRRLLQHDFRGAHRIAIVAAYFAPPWRLRRALCKAAKRGIVRLLLPGKSDVTAMRLAAQHLYERLLRQGIEIFEYQPQVLHAKLVIVDDIVYVGSCNFDVRSLQLNFDFLLRIPSPELAQQARQLFLRSLEHSLPITLPEWHRALTGWKRVLQFVAYWVVVRLDPLIARRHWRALR